MTAILEPDAASRAILQAMLHGSTGVASAEALSDHIQSSPAEFAVVIGPSITTDEAASFAQWARVNRPDLGVILLRDTVDAGTLSLALRSGMREVVQSKDLAGITTAVQRARSVASAIGQTMLGEVQAAAEEAKARLVAEAEAQRAADEAPQGKLFTVFSTKGGVGKSLVAVNTAVALSQRGHRVCLVDLDVNSGDVAIMLQLSPSRNVNDLVGFRGGIDEGAIESLLTKYTDTMSVVAAPVHLDSPDQASADDIGQLLDGLKAMFEYVVVDTSGVFDDQALAALDRSARILLVGTLDIPALKGVKLATSTLDLLNFPRESWNFVLNRADAKVGLTQSEFESTLGLKADATLVSSREVLAAVNRGEPLVSAFPANANSKALTTFAATLAQAYAQDDGVAAAPAGRKASRLRMRKG
ncbi:putative type II/IV secretion system ATPase TadZ/CpaE, associated with Flp pilus assembly [metagenome]|uniref:Putative type II/IV secretion system ATPase TadZ/CpaE, associated with Flp pilus assembly n=1 Tax=metagenome TaxID=256318 RepID=A0A2P2CDU8_9ZZZZ